MDAVAIASQGSEVRFKTNVVLFKKCVSDGKIQRFRKFDKVRYLGVEYFIKGRMSTGYAILMDSKGTIQNIS